MKIDRIGYSGPTVVVLGAGATRGSSFVPRTSQVLPPLDADFFTQAQRLPGGEQEALMRELLRYAVRIFGKNFKLTMEGYLTQVEHLGNVFDDYRTRGRPPDNPYYPMRNNLLQVLACVLHEAIGTTPKCRFHRRLISRLDPRDALLSFNYDCAVDYNLKEYGAGKWNPATGYGHPCERQSGFAWSPTSAAPPDKTLLLLKLHGSLNWFPYPGEEVHAKLRLKERWWRQHGDANFEIVPPEWNKPTIRRGIYKAIWRKARQRLATCTGMAFLGYSLPPTDLPAQALFRVDAHKAAKLKLLVVANPDPDVRRRIRDVLRRRISQTTRILVFDTLEDLHAFWYR